MHRAVALDRARWYSAQGWRSKWQEFHLFLVNSFDCQGIQVTSEGKNGWGERIIKLCKLKSELDCSQTWRQLREFDLSVSPRGHMVSHSISRKTCHIITSIFHKRSWFQPYHVIALFVSFSCNPLFLIAKITHIFQWKVLGEKLMFQSHLFLSVPCKGYYPDSLTLGKGAHSQSTGWKRLIREERINGLHQPVTMGLCAGSLLAGLSTPLKVSA